MGSSGIAGNWQAWDKAYEDAISAKRMRKEQATYELHKALKEDPSLIFELLKLLAERKKQNDQHK